MAGSIELSTQGITGAFRTEPQVVPQIPQRAVTESKSDSGLSKDGNKEASQVLKGDLNRQAVEDVASALNSASKAIDRDLHFSVDENTGKIVIKVTNSSTGEVIRVIPPEDVAQTRDNFGSLVGLLFSNKS